MNEASLSAGARALGACALLLTSCTGNIPMGGSGGAGGSSSMGGSGSNPPAACNAEKDPGPSPMRLLSREQYLNTVRDLVGDIAQLGSVFGQTSQPSSFGLVQGDVSQVELENFQKAADLIAATLAADKPRLSALVPCSTGTSPRNCAKSFVQSFGARAYRAPVTDNTDIERHLALYDAGAATSHEHGIEVLLRGMLQASRFLYQVELGTSEKAGPKAVKLSGYEVAARLSYAIWNTAPDAGLREAARSGALSNPNGVAIELERLIEDPRGSSVVRRFLEGLIHVADLDNVVKDDRFFPEWQNAALRTAMRGQAQSFFDHVLRSEAGRLSALFTSQTVFVNQALAPWYGVTAGADFRSVQVTGGKAAGLLTLPALLTLQAKPGEGWPIYRGKFVREVLLCQQLPSPPPNIPKPPEVTAGVSTRERLSQHEVDPSCSGCHRLMDPIGFGFEQYDAIGRYRTMDGGRPVDARGEVLATRDMDGPFTGVAELAQKLAGSAEVRECIARQYFRFMMSRFEQSADECSVGSMLESFRESGADLNVLPHAVVRTDAFLYRRPLDLQVSP
ncbi:MAG TPA: DUF1592 domain-containing protein [Polyangiaceae bacterium]|nr:DUF1592 domain-containing protein [Polyangiaceae bacterium]